jgi:hypothetical protein
VRPPLVFPCRHAPFVSACDEHVYRGMGGSACCTTPDEDSLPPYPLRLSIAKVLIEVGLLKGAIRVLERLLLEDDTVSEVWFLLSAAYRDTKRPGTARQYLVTFVEVWLATMPSLPVLRGTTTVAHVVPRDPLLPSSPPIAPSGFGCAPTQVQGACKCFLSGTHSVPPSIPAAGGLQSAGSRGGRP